MLKYYKSRLKSTVTLLLFASALLPFPISLIVDGNLAYASAESMKSYTHSSLYTIRYPSSWIFDQFNSKDRLTIWNQKPPSVHDPSASSYLIKTDISFSHSSFDAEPENMGDSGAKRVSFQKINLNGMEAIQTYWSNLPSDFNNAIITTIRYSQNRTVNIVSFYDSYNSSAEDKILSLHNSFHKP